jgi:NAD(P)-dependent dehydrogenase (short-subunit alcohol dehydrogenase family)
MATAPPRRAVVLGGARNLGAAITRDLLGRGARVASVARTPADLESLQALGAATVCADAADRAALNDALRAAASHIGPLDLIVNAVAPARPPNDGTGYGGGAMREAIPAGAAATRALTHAAALELAGDDLHVALLVVDGPIASPKTARMTAGMAPAAIVDPVGVAAAVHALATHRSRVDP